MPEAVGILGSAENVQTNVVVLWLEKLASEFQERGQVQEAINCIRKAMYHFGAEKGESLAQASQLSDNLVELLLQLGDKEAARDAVAQCLAARMQLFGRQLVVCQSMLRLANLEVKLGKKGDLQAAMQHATNAANLSGELTDEYAKQADSWKGRLSAKNSDMAVRRVRAAFVHATAHKFLADHSPHQDQAKNSLRAACAALRPCISAASRYMSDLSASSQGHRDQQGRKGGSPPSQLDALADLFIDSQLLLLDCVESLSAMLGTEESTEKQKLGQIADEVLRQLGV
ncbi:hypothetical protein DUNSADRAFT_8693 [Dunaliella salina]|uniref:Uncharacterized protein n=1 Tax=Dunaliella salina TaxID=3046 RepID=A0ABQ7GJ43_DUNSA|nr:hypothetical protein DUNSADRAFT_8693 [Dunaliella salina]|eukprot:KAF5834609.1 hypothetical protein DUNSADRAFT_8693 [Dunaliella salina]